MHLSRKLIRTSFLNLNASLQLRTKKKFKKSDSVRNKNQLTNSLWRLCVSGKSIFE